MLDGHILIAEDEEHICRVLSLLLRRHGYMVSAVRDGLQALEKIVESRNGPHPVDLLLTDVQMDGLTGIELIARLDSLQLLLPVLIMTGYARGQPPVDLSRGRFMRFIEKPFKAEKLIELVSLALEKGA